MVARRLRSNIFIARSENMPSRRSSVPRKFGVIALDDASCGLFFAGLDDTLSYLDACDPKQFTEMSTLELVKHCLREGPLFTAVGLGALNAVSQHLLRTTGFSLDRATSVSQLDLTDATHVGMVSFFAPLIREWENNPGTLTVIEKDPKFRERSGPVEVIEQTDRLRDCDRVLITGSTLINDTLDDVLSHCDSKAPVALVGPSASCLPDPIFDRGVDVVGSTKYCITRDQYPGIRQMIRGA